MDGIALHYQNEAVDSIASKGLKDKAVINGY